MHQGVLRAALRVCRARAYIPMSPKDYLAPQVHRYLRIDADLVDRYAPILSPS